MKGTILLKSYDFSSGALRQNYVGSCRLDVFNLCHTQIIRVVNTTFQLYDGEWTSEREM